MYVDNEGRFYYGLRVCGVSKFVECCIYMNIDYC